MTTPTKNIHPTYAAAVGKESIIDHFLPVPTKGSNRKGKTPAKSTKGKPKAKTQSPPTPMTMPMPMPTRTTSFRMKTRSTN